jgi:hypothetical protein
LFALRFDTNLFSLTTPTSTAMPAQKIQLLVLLLASTSAMGFGLDHFDQDKIEDEVRPVGRMQVGCRYL